MDLTEVRWFLAVAELGSVSRAAAAVHVSQPGLSRGMARLERELGARLFSRDGRALRLNALGLVFRDYAQRIVAEAEAARGALELAQDPTAGEVALAFLHTFGGWLVPDLLRRYRALRPGVRFRLDQAGADVVAAAVREGRADVGLTSLRPRKPGLGWRRLAVQRLSVALPPEHDLAGRRRLRLADIAGEPMIAIRSGSGLRAITDELLRAAGVQPPIAFESEDIATARGFVAAGLGWAVLPEDELATQRSVRHVALAERGARREIGAVWSTKRDRTPAAEAFLEFVVGTAGPG